LGIEVDDGDGEPEIEPGREGPRVEVGPGLRRGDRRRQFHLLGEEHQHVPVDADRRPWAHVGDHLLPCQSQELKEDVARSASESDTWRCDAY